MRQVKQGQPGSMGSGSSRNRAFFRLIVPSAALDEETALARVARGHHAVEHVDAAGDALDEVLRAPHAHQVPRLVRGHARRGHLEGGVHRLDGLADAESAHREAVEGRAAQLVDVAPPQLVVDATLEDREERAIRLATRREAAMGPPRRAGHRFLVDRPRRGRRSRWSRHIMMSLPMAS